MSWNIRKDIIEFAGYLGLEPMPAGGNIDFIGFIHENKSLNYLVCDKLTGDTIEGLDSPASINFSFNFDWIAIKQFHFETGREALLALANPAFRSAALWNSLELLSVEKKQDLVNSINNCSYQNEGDFGLKEIISGDYVDTILQVFKVYGTHVVIG